MAAKTGYSSFLVSKLCERLIHAGYVSETGSGDSTGGRRPALLSVSPGLGRIVGIHLGTVNARVVVVDLAGNLLSFQKGPSRVSEGPYVALPHLMRLAEAALDQAQSSIEDVLGVGMGISGILDRASGTTLSWPKVPSWTNVPVRDFLKKSFPCRVAIEDTPRTLALAESRLGVARSSKDFLFIALGAGIGAAMFMNSELYVGSEGFAGELGHVMLDPKGHVCGCGNRGCLETIVSASALIAQAKDAVIRGISSDLWQLTGGDPVRLSLELLAEAAELGDRFALRLFRETGEAIARAITLTIHLLNPQQIVLGGGLIAAAGKFLLPVIQQHVALDTLPRLAASARIELSTLAEKDWARGAASLVTEASLEEFFLVAPNGASKANPRRTSKKA